MELTARGDCLACRYPVVPPMQYSRSFAFPLPYAVTALKQPRNHAVADYGAIGAGRSADELAEHSGEVRLGRGSRAYTRSRPTTAGASVISSRARGDAPLQNKRCGGRPCSAGTAGRSDPCSAEQCWRAGIASCYSPRCVSMCSSTRLRQTGGNPLALYGLGNLRHCRHLRSCLVCSMYVFCIQCQHICIQKIQFALIGVALECMRDHVMERLNAAGRWAEGSAGAGHRHRCFAAGRAVG